MTLSKTLRTGTLAAFLLVPSLASAQTTTAQPPTARAVAPGQQFRAKQVLGTKIMLQSNQSVGVVDDLVFDEAGNLDYLIVDNGGKLVTVPWEAAKFDLEKRTAVLPLTVEQYKVIPTFTTTTYPTFYAPAYRAETYRFYGLTPRELRRIDRR